MAKIKRFDDRLIVQDSPGCFWLMGLFFIFVGGIFVLGPLGLFNNNHEVPVWVRVASFVMGSIGVIAGGYLIRESPLTTTTVDVITRRIMIREVGLAGKRARVLNALQVREVIVAVKEDSDGDSTFQLQLLLTSGEHVPLSKLWATGRDSCDRQAESVATFLRERLRLQVGGQRPAIKTGKLGSVPPDR